MHGWIKRELKRWTAICKMQRHLEVEAFDPQYDDSSADDV